MLRAAKKLFVQVGNTCREPFSIHSSTDNASGIACTFSTGIKVFYLGMMKCFCGEFSQEDAGSQWLPLPLHWSDILSFFCQRDQAFT
jgi:hypothetical protein